MSTTRTYTPDELAKLDRPAVRAIAKELGVDPGSKYNTPAIIKRILAAPVDAAVTTVVLDPAAEDEDANELALTEAVANIDGVEPFPHSISMDDAGRSTVVFVDRDGEQTIVTSDEEFYNDVVAAILRGEDPTQVVIDARRALEIFAEATGVEVEVEDDVVADVEAADGDEEAERPRSGVKVGGQEVDAVLVKTIIRYANEGRNPENLLKFIDRLNENPNERSRQELFDWARKQDLQIDTDGFLLAFKSVHNTETEGVFRSVHGITTDVFVNGEKQESGFVLQRVGDVVTTPAEQVDDDFRVGCSNGLHVGSYHYARSFSGNVVMEVRVDPAAVVSVPREDTDKMRCAAYEVLAVHDKGFAAAGWREGSLGHHEPEAQDKEAVTDELLQDVLATASVPKGFLGRWKAKREARKAASVEG